MPAEPLQQKTVELPKDDCSTEAQDCFISARKTCIERPWGEIFRGIFNSEVRHQLFDRILGCLKRSKHSIQIHPLEKDLVYLSALSISKKRQIFISFPVAPVALGILMVIYYSHLYRAVSSKYFVIWIRPQNNGKIYNLRTTKAFNLVEDEDTYYSLSERVVCIPNYQFKESSTSQKLRVIMVRSLLECVELLNQSNYCSLVLIDDPSGRTYPFPSNYGSEAFELANLCVQKQIPMIGIVPPWIMRDIEYHEKKQSCGILIWPIDFFALRSYTGEGQTANNNKIPHPIEESYSLLERKRLSLKEAQVTIKTFNFDNEDEEKIADLFQESSNLLIDLARQPELKAVSIIGWEIWRHLSAPVLPFYLLWNNFLEKTLNRLKIAANKSKDNKAIDLHNILNSLALRLYKLKHNPFVEIVRTSDVNTIIALEDAERAKALEEFLMGSNSYPSFPQVFPISEIRGMSGEKLIVIGQPKACYRDILQTTFFRRIDVLLWSVLSERAERWWRNLEIDAREWHRKTWRVLTEDKEEGRYGFSPEYTLVQIVNTGKAKLNKSINLSKLEENFSSLTISSLDSGLTNYIANNLESHYLVEFEQGLKIRVAPRSEFLVLLGQKAHVVSVREITPGTNIVLFDGMTRDELFAQKAGLLEDTKVNYLYRLQLESWRELVKQQVKKSNLQTICQEIIRDTLIPIGEETIRYNWMSGDDFLSLPREKEHFFWFIPPLAHSGFEEFWLKANNLRIKRRQLGQVISACAQEGWKERKSEEIVFQYQQVFITVGELRNAMSVLKVQSKPKLIRQPPEFPYNRLFRMRPSG
ncbi:MAG: hypothetical protein QNJ63_24195 [Calothrix sp. MO_192.B10]|nr:hypothetical protein [Calothrix sp. MO_192.B10]